MTRRSATSSRSAEQPEVVLFVDRSLGRHRVVDALRDAGMRVEAHDDHFPQDTFDQEWIPEVTRRGWVILTKDARISRRALELAAVRETGARVFVLTRQRMTGDEMAELFVRWKTRIVNIARSQPPPFWAAVTPSGVRAQKL